MLLTEDLPTVVSVQEAFHKIRAIANTVRTVIHARDVLQTVMVLVLPIILIIIMKIMMIEMKGMKTIPIIITEGTGIN